MAATTIEGMNALETAKKNELLGIFDVALKNAGESLELAQGESLVKIAREYVAAFQTARNVLATKGDFPVVPGNDPHNLSREDSSPIRVALSGVYGFTMQNGHESKSPHTIETLNRLKPIANAIHMDGYCICT